MKTAFPILGILTAALLSYALYQALVVAPTEQTMGDARSHHDQARSLDPDASEEGEEEARAIDEDVEAPHR